MSALLERLGVLLTVPDLVATSGGPSRSVPALALGLEREGARVEILTRVGPDGAFPRLAPNPARVRTVAVPCPTGRWRDVRVVPALRTALRTRLAARDLDLVHDAGIWMPSNHVVTVETRRASVPLIVSPRGMLEPWALGYRAWKKQAAWLLFQRRDLTRARALHATSAMELEGMRAAGLRQPVAVIPNGVELPPDAFSARSGPSAMRTALFLSRVHPKKGLLDLVAAWATVQPKGWRMRIVGPDADGHRAEVAAAARASGRGDDFVFEDEIDGEEKWRAYREASLFILPSHSENFGLVVAEALACGLPVITTTGTPWSELLERKAGWWVAPGSATLGPALHEATNLSDPELREMGARGAVWVGESFTWDSVAARMLAFYRWVLERGERPDFVALP